MDKTECNNALLGGWGRGGSAPEWRTRALSFPARSTPSRSAFPMLSAGSDSRTHAGPARLPPTQSAPPPPSRFISLPTQRCVEDSRALHLVAIRFQAAAGLLKPRADVRAGELLLFILSFFSCLLPWEGRRGWVRRAPKWRRQRRGSPRLGALLLFLHPIFQTDLALPRSGSAGVGAALAADSVEAPPD